jgi:esterase/lipase superfamily enzyme
MPSGGQFGNYTDWYNGGAGGVPMWETYHIKQLVPWIDQHLPTDGARDGRFVAGLSMGGGGAAAYAALHPDLFSAVGIFSGAVDTNNLFVQPLTSTAGLQDGHPDRDVYGDRATQEVRWRGHNPWDLAQNLSSTSLIQVDTGDGGSGGPGGDTGDPVEAGVYQESVAFHRKLDELGIPHIWDYYGAGGHAWYYWNRDLTQFLPRAMALYGDPPARRAHFDYTAIEPKYDVFGWSVAVDRPALEFSTVRNAGADGFSLSGSGKALVTTARYWKPGTQLSVLTGDKRQAMTADDHGRLTVPLTLGPANPEQQYSPQAKAWMAQNNTGDDIGRPVDEAQRWPVYTVSVAITPVKKAAAARKKSRTKRRRGTRKRRVKRHERARVPRRTHRARG